MQLVLHNFFSILLVHHAVTADNRTENQTENQYKTCYKKETDMNNYKHVFEHVQQCTAKWPDVDQQLQCWGTKRWKDMKHDNVTVDDCFKNDTEWNYARAETSYGEACVDLDDKTQSDSCKTTCDTWGSWSSCKIVGTSCMQTREAKTPKTVDRTLYSDCVNPEQSQNQSRPCSADTSAEECLIDCKLKVEKSSCSSNSDTPWECTRKVTKTFPLANRTRVDVGCRYDNSKSNSLIENCTVLQDAQTLCHDKKGDCPGKIILETNTCSLKGNDCFGRQSWKPHAPKGYRFDDVCNNITSNLKEIQCKNPNDKPGCRRSCSWANWETTEPCALLSRGTERFCQRKESRVVKVTALNGGTECLDAESESIKNVTCNNTRCKTDCLYTDYVQTKPTTCTRTDLNGDTDTLNDCVIWQSRSIEHEPFGGGMSCNESSLKRPIPCDDHEEDALKCHRNCTEKLNKIFPQNETQWIEATVSGNECGNYKIIHTIKEQYLDSLVPYFGMQYQDWCNRIKDGGVIRNVVAPACPGDKAEYYCRKRLNSEIQSICSTTCGSSEIRIVETQLQDWCMQDYNLKRNTNNYTKLMKEFVEKNQRCPTFRPCGTVCEYQTTPLANLLFTTQGFIKVEEDRNPTVRCGATRIIKSYMNIIEYAKMGTEIDPVECKRFSQLNEDQDDYFSTEFNVRRCLSDCIPFVWEDWTTCSVTCGVGSRRRSRKILFNTGSTKQDCDVTEDVIPCMYKPCESDIRNNYCIYLFYDEIDSYEIVTQNKAIKIAGNESCVDKTTKLLERRVPNHHIFNYSRAVVNPDATGEIEKDEGSITVLQIVFISAACFVFLLIIGLIAFYVARRKVDKQMIIMGKNKEKDRNAKTDSQSLSPQVTERNDDYPDADETSDASESMEEVEEPNSDHTTLATDKPPLTETVVTIDKVDDERSMMNTQNKTYVDCHPASKVKFLKPVLKNSDAPVNIIDELKKKSKQVRQSVVKVKPMKKKE